MGRYLGIDYGRRRIGLALSDPSAMLASPWATVQSSGRTREAAAAIQDRIRVLQSEEGDVLEGIVVGLPRRLGGEETPETAEARALGAAVAELSGLPVHLQDERLSSREAESRLALTERSWRRRKAHLDAAAAAVILQDFLDGHHATVSRREDE